MNQTLLTYYRKFKAKQIRGHHPGRMIDSKEENEVECLNCHTRYQGNYCPNCGQEAKTGRLRVWQGVEDLIGIFTNFDSGIMHTCLELIYRPGYMMYDYIKGHRKEYVKPIQLIFLLTTIVFVEHYLLYGSDFGELNIINNADVNFDVPKKEDAIIKLTLKYFSATIEWLASNRALLCMVLASFLVLPNKLCFLKTEVGNQLNLSEHFFAMMYVGCQILMLEVLEMPLVRFIPGYNDTGMGFNFLILLWDFNQLFRLSVRKTLVRTALSALLAVALLAVALFLFILILAPLAAFQNA